MLYETPSWPAVADIHRAIFDTFYERYCRDLTADRLRIAKYVIQTFFRPDARLFVQASSSTLALSSELNQDRARSSPLLTNSVMLRLLLNDEVMPHVIPIGVPIFDWDCGGMLPWAGDDQLARYLKMTIRAHTGEPTLHGTVIYPLEMSVADGPCFKRIETAQLVAHLAALSDEVFVLCEAKRIATGACRYSVQSEAKAARTTWAEMRKKMHLVIAGVQPEDRDRIHKVFSRDYRLHLLGEEQDTMEKQFPSSGSAVPHAANEAQGAVAVYSGRMVRRANLYETPKPNQATFERAIQQRSMSTSEKERFVQDRWQQILKSENPFTTCMAQIVGRAAKLSGSKQGLEGYSKKELKEFCKSVIELCQYYEALSTTGFMSGGSEGGAEAQAETSRNTITTDLKKWGLSSKKVLKARSLPEALWESDLQPLVKAILYSYCSDQSAPTQPISQSPVPNARSTRRVRAAATKPEVCSTP
jgi:hypothetical protein